MKNKKKLVVVKIVIINNLITILKMVKCILCSSKIEENSGKLKGTITKVRNEKKRNQLIYVCSDCQNVKNWIEKAKIIGV